MKRLCWVVFAFSLAGCPRKETPPESAVDAGPKILSEKEPNNRTDEAMELPESTLVHGGLTADPSKPDEDWYALAPSTPRSADLLVSAIPGTDVTLEIYDADRNRLIAVNSEGVDKPERLPHVVVRGRLFARVTSVKKGSGGAYDLTVTYSELTSGAEMEPNDRAADANVLQLGQAVTGFIGHAGDEDWYKFELPTGGTTTGAAPAAPPAATPSEDAGESVPPAGGETAVPSPATATGTAAPPAVPPEAPSTALKIDLTPVPGVRFELSVLSAAEAPLFSVKSKDDEGLSLRNIGVRANDQIFYVVIKSTWAGTGTGKNAKRGYNADQAYTLTVAQEEAGAFAELEPNDEILKATPLPENGYREGFLSPKTDADYYVLRTSRPVLAKVQLSGVERLDLMMSVVKPGEKEGAPEQTLLRINEGALKEPEYLNNFSCETECWLKVEGALKKVDGKWVKDYENSELPYRLSITTVPDTGAEEREPNQSAAQATPLTLGKPVRGTIHPKKDTDFYKLDLSDRPVKTAIRAVLLGILKVDVGLYLYRLDDEGNTELVQTADRAKGDAPEQIRYSAEPGVYLLEVRDSKNREANFQDSYQLTVQEGE